MLAAAKAFQEANPDIPLVFIPLFDGPAGKGKYPNHPGGHFVEVTSGWQKRAVSVPDNHPAWAAATGYGIVLTHNPHLIIIDIDNEDALTLKQQAELHASPGLTYFTRKGQHHWYKVKPEDYPPMGGKNYARPWGETWHHTPRQVAGPGSADKPAPTDLNIPEQIPPLDALLEQPERRREYDPKPAYAAEWQPGQGPRHDWLLHTAYHYLRQRNATEQETKKALQSSAAYKSKAAEYGTAATDKELDDIIIWQQQQKPEEPEPEEQPEYYYYGPEPPPPYQGEGNLDLGDLTIIGQEIRIDNKVVDYVRGYPLRPDQFPQSLKSLYDKYLAFYQQVIRLPVPPPVRIATQKHLDDYLEGIPNPYRVETEDGTGHITLPPLEWTLLLAKKKQGKTWAALTILQNLRVPTIYIASEGMTAVARRVKQLGGMTTFPKTIFNGRPDANGIRDIAEDAEDLQAELIVIDVLAPFLEDEIKASSFNDMERLLAPITNGRTVLLVHHLGLDISKGARGTSRIEDAVGYGYDLTLDIPDEAEYKRIVISPKEDLDRHGLEATGVEIRLGEDEHGRLINPIYPITNPPARGNINELIKAWHQAYLETTSPQGRKNLPTKSGVAGKLQSEFGVKKSVSYDRIEAAIGEIYDIIPEAGFNRNAGLALLPPYEDAPIPD